MVNWTASNFTLLLQTLNLTQGLSKPEPATTGYSVDGQAPLSTASFAGLSSLDGSGQGLNAGNPPVRTSTGESDGQSVAVDGASNSCSWEPYDAPSFGPPSFPPFDQAKANVYRYRQQQSVNLGSWFVHEAWMTPSLFTCAANQKASEVDIAHGWGNTTGARAVLEKHWDTFITESDFQYLASIGINTVRLPIGYWVLGADFCKGTPFEDVSDVYQNAWPRVVRAINTAAAHGIGVLVDLHGAPGSQNGQQHSGISDGQTNLFGSPDNINKTITALTFMVRQLTYVSNVVGIQLLNEPQGVPSLEDFYSQAITAMRAVYPNTTNFPLYLHDGFNLDRFSYYVANRKDFVVQDHHSYFVFTPQDDSEPASQHTADINGGIAESLRAASNRQRRNLVVDEFSCALTPDSLKNEADPGQAQMAFCTGQAEVYANTTAGWSFWSYRKEGCSDDPGWCFTAAVGKALPSQFFSYGVPPPPEPPQLPPLSSLMDGMTTAPPVMNMTSANMPNPADPPYSFAEDLGSGNAGFRRTVDSRHRQETSIRRDAPNKSFVAAQQRSLIKGYSDGFITAKIFGAYGLSKLGFSGQFILNSIAALGAKVVAPGTEDMYTGGFEKGLADGENVVAMGLVAQQSGGQQDSA